MAKTVSLTLPLTREAVADLEVALGPRVHHARCRP